MKRPHIQRLRDILEMADAVADMIDGRDFSAYVSDFRTRKAVERCIEIISEASRHIPDAEKARFPGVPWAGVAGVGNILRHEYQRVADDVIWRTATRSLPELRRVASEMIDGEPG